MILADSGFWVALMSQRDKHHEQAQRAAQEHAGETLISTWPVLCEATYLIGERIAPEQRILFLRRVADGACELHALTSESLERMAMLMHKYRDREMDLADASLVLLAEDLGEGRILTTDEDDFLTYRWRKTKPFQNLLVSG